MTQKFNYKVQAFILLSVLFIGCQSRKIEYSLNKIPPAANQKFNGLTFDIEYFKDNRRAHEKNNVLFKSVREQTSGESKWFWNTEEKYESYVPNAMTELLAEHLRRRGSFEAVKIHNKEFCDYYIDGTLNFFYAAQWPGWARESFIVSSFLPVLIVPSLIFALSEKTKTVVVIEIKDLSIYNRSNELIFQTDLSKRYERKCRAWGGRKAVYRNANHLLREFNSELIQVIENEILKAEKS